MDALANFDFAALAAIFEDIVAYVQKILAVLESKFGFEEWYENQETT